MTMWSRRSFLARTGVLGAAAAASSLPATPVGAQGLDRLLEDGTEAFEPALRDLTRDTFAALAAFVCPGPDRFSVQQGETDDDPGGVDADGGGFLAHALDTYLPFPDAVLRPLVQGLATATTEPGTPLPDALAGIADDVARTIDDALRGVLANDGTVPASLPAAMLLNLGATTVAPQSLAGPFPTSPFANLDMAGKASVFAFLDEQAATLVAQLDTQLDEPARAAASGLVRFLSAALVHFTAFGIYSEWSVSRGRGDVFARPMGWDLTGFTPGEMMPADGWDEFRGYWRGQRMPEDAKVFPTRGVEAT